MTKTTRNTSFTDHRRPAARTSLVVWGAALLPVALTVGCSASDADSSQEKPSPASTKLDTAFVARAEKVCQPYMKYNTTHYFKVVGFNRFDPNPAILRRIADFMGRNPSYRTLGSDLEELGQPASGRAAWRNVTDDIKASEHLMRNEVRSAHQGAVAAFKTYDERLSENSAVLHADLTKLGLSQGSACYSAQGDPFEISPPSE